MGSPNTESLTKTPITFTQLAYDKQEINSKPALSLKLIEIAIENPNAKRLVINSQNGSGITTQMNMK